MSNPEINRWHGKSSENVLAESFHEIRNPILRMAGYLTVLHSMKLSEELARHFIDDALNCALSAQDIVESDYQYMNEKREE